MPFDNDDDSTDDEDLNSGAKGKQKASRAVAGDGGYGAARSRDALETAARDREALDAQIAAGQAVPDVNSNYDIVRMDANGNFIDQGQMLAAQYIQPGDPWVSGSSDAVVTTPQALRDSNSTESDLVEPEPAEVHRAVQRSRSAEQLEIENARKAADKKREDEARARRQKAIAKGVGITTGVLSVIAILVPTILKVTGVIGGGNTTTTTTGGGGATGDANAPAVKDVTVSGLNPNKSTSVDVPGVILTAADPTVDKASVKLTSFDSDDTTETRLTVSGVGVFRLDPATGKLDFAPVAYFLGGKAQAGVTIANVSKARSARSAITLEFDTRPIVADQFIQADLAQTNTVVFNPLTGKGVDMGGPATKGTHPINPVSVVFRVPMPLEGGEPQQGTITITGGKKAVADGEGTWEISSTDGTITFTRDPKFNGDPTPLTYSVFDTKGIESNVGSLVISSFLSQVTKAVGVLNGMDDASFWTAYRNNVINADYGALNAPAEIVGKLTLFRTVHLVIAELTRQSLKASDRTAVQNAVPAAATLNASYKTWAAASFDPAAALTEAENLTPAGNAVDGINRGTRLLRLIIISRLLGRWQDAMDKAAGN